MGKLVKRVAVCFLLAAVFWCGTVISDRQTLRRELIRLHVVANSDSPEDQAVKLRLRNAVLESLREELSKLADPEQAKEYLYQKLPVLESIARETLEAVGYEGGVTVSLNEEPFPLRVADRLALPAGVYNTLRITIGQGDGQNWWCVLYPSVLEEDAVAAGAGFDREGYRLRFACLELLGRLENFLFPG